METYCPSTLGSAPSYNAAMKTTPHGFSIRSLISPPPSGDTAPLDYSYGFHPGSALTLPSTDSLACYDKYYDRSASGYFSSRAPGADMTPLNPGGGVPQMSSTLDSTYGSTTANLAPAAIDIASSYSIPKLAHSSQESRDSDVFSDRVSLDCDDMDDEVMTSSTGVAKPSSSHVTGKLLFLIGYYFSSIDKMGMGKLKMNYLPEHNSE